MEERMQNLIAGLLAALGTLLVLAGGTIVALQNLTPATAADPTAGRPTLLARLRALGGGDRLLLWGVVLLVIAAIAVGALSFNLGASAGTK
jgi:hypothetical protein